MPFKIVTVDGYAHPRLAAFDSKTFPTKQEAADFLGKSFARWKGHPNLWSNTKDATQLFWIEQTNDDGSFLVGTDPGSQVDLKNATLADLFNVTQLMSFSISDKRAARAAQLTPLAPGPFVSSEQKSYLRTDSFYRHLDNIHTQLATTLTEFAEASRCVPKERKWS